MKYYTLYFLFLPYVNGDFLFGHVIPGSFEYEELNGWMTIRQAVFTCEHNFECVGFSYMGSLSYEIKANVYFFRIINFPETKFPFTSWITYTVNRDYATYIGKVPRGPNNNVTTIKAHNLLYKDELINMCNSESWCSGVALGKNGLLRLYSSVNMSTFDADSDWITLIKLSAPPSSFVDNTSNFKLNTCCPNVPTFPEFPYTVNNIIDNLPRIHCNISQQDFINHYIRLGKAVVLTNCTNNDWAKDYDFTLNSVLEMFHSNNTSTPFSNLEPLRLLQPTFTHVYTPNDILNTNEDIEFYKTYKNIRLFDRITNNYDCKFRNTNCRLFEKFEKPPPLPEDIFDATNYVNDLHWVISSHKNTGSHVHSDPDYSGAWNYLVNGLKWWVIFPRGFDVGDLQCDPSCSIHDDEFGGETFRWFHFVLPQLQNKKFFGQEILQGVQYPGESIYLPFSMPHTVHNLEDNVAVTRNQLFIDALPELVRKITLDNISLFRPKWDYQAFQKIYYGGIASSEDRIAMREMYTFVIEEFVNNKNITNVCEMMHNDTMNRYVARYKNHTFSHIRYPQDAYQGNVTTLENYFPSAIEKDTDFQMYLNDSEQEEFDIENNEYEEENMD